MRRSSFPCRRRNSRMAALPCSRRLDSWRRSLPMARESLSTSRTNEDILIEKSLHPVECLEDCR
ncbi:hypothetical protein ACHAWF_000660 [Thalassiosira exigua]